MNLNEICTKTIEAHHEQLRDRDLAILQLSNRIKDLEALCERAQRILETDAHPQEMCDKVYELLDGRDL